MSSKALETPKPNRNIFKSVFFLLFKIITGVLVLALILTLFLFLKPIPVTELSAVSNLNYDQSLNKVKSQVSAEKDKVEPVCQTKLLEHSKKTEKVIVLFHGFTNCPAQFSEFAQKLFNDGYNVYIPRIPHHGLKNVLTEDLQNLTVKELENTISDSISVATGLGDKVTLFGISGGGVMAAFGGYFFKEVNSVVFAAPLFTPGFIDVNALSFLINAIDTVPNIFFWWDDKAKEKVEGPKYAYPKYSSKAAGAFFKLSQSLKVALENNQVSQKGKTLVLLTKENDPAISNKTARGMIETWVSYPDTTIITYQFASDKAPIHDFIDPNQTKANTDYIYPIVKNLINKI